MTTNRRVEELEKQLVRLDNELLLLNERVSRLEISVAVDVVFPLASLPNHVVRVNEDLAIDSRDSTIDEAFE